MNTLFIEHYYLFLIVYFLITTGLALLAAGLFRRFFTKDSQLRSLLINLSVSGFAFLYFFILLEGVFAYCFVQSDGFAFTLSANRWHAKYWKPINSYGYRDYEPEWGKKTVFVVGDSFAAGAGIRNIDNRLSNVLSQKLGDDWTVTILAQSGWSPDEYLKALQDHQEKPDVIIISYFLNDIVRAAETCGMAVPKIPIS